MKIRKGQLVLYSNKATGGTSIQQAVNRPAIVVSNNKCNAFSTVITIVPLTSRKTKTELPTHVAVPHITKEESIALCEQPMSVDRNECLICEEVCDNETMKKIDNALMIQFGIIKPRKNEETSGNNRLPSVSNENEIHNILTETRWELNRHIEFLKEVNERLGRIKHD